MILHSRHYTDMTYLFLQTVASRDCLHQPSRDCYLPTKVVFFFNPSVFPVNSKQERSIPPPTLLPEKDSLPLASRGRVGGREGGGGK